MINITFQFGLDKCEVVLILLKELIIYIRNYSRMVDSFVWEERGQKRHS